MERQVLPREVSLIWPEDVFRRVRELAEINDPAAHEAAVDAYRALQTRSHDEFAGLYDKWRIHEPKEHFELVLNALASNYFCPLEFQFRLVKENSLAAFEGLAGNQTFDPAIMVLAWSRPRFSNETKGIQNFFWELSKHKNCPDWLAAEILLEHDPVGPKRLGFAQHPRAPEEVLESLAVDFLKTPLFSPNRDAVQQIGLALAQNSRTPRAALVSLAFHVLLLPLPLAGGHDDIVACVSYNRRLFESDKLAIRDLESRRQSLGVLAVVTLLSASLIYNGVFVATLHLAGLYCLLTGQLIAHGIIKPKPLWYLPAAIQRRDTGAIIRYCLAACVFGTLVYYLWPIALANCAPGDLCLKNWMPT
jgi:hypothetical protein